MTVALSVVRGMVTLYVAFVLLALSVAFDSGLVFHFCDGGLVGRCLTIGLQDNSVLVGQQKARDKSLFLDSSGQTTTTAIPRRLRTRTRLTATNGLKVAATPGLKDKVVVEGKRGLTRLTATNGLKVAATPGLGAKVVVEGRRGLNRVRGRVTRPKSTQAEGGEEGSAVVTRQRTVMRLEKDGRPALGERSRVRVRGRQRMRGSVGRLVAQETQVVDKEDMSDIAS